MKIEYNINEIDNAAQTVLDTYPLVKCFAFYADMGSGKTTFINSLCKKLGVSEYTSSPTFSIINEYRGEGDIVIFHTDWYRLKGTHDAIEAGIQDILENKNAYCFIEWPEIAEELLSADCLRIKISVTGKETRIIEI